MSQSALTADAALPTAALRAFTAEVRRDGALFLSAIGYTAGVGVLCAVLGKPQFYHPLVYLPVWLSGLVAVLGGYALIVQLPQVIRACPESVVSAFVARLREQVTPRFAAHVLLFMALGLFTGAFTSMKSLLGELAPFWADRVLADVDAAVHLGVDPWVLLQPLLGHHAVTRLIQNLYMSGWLMVMLGVMTAATFSSRLAHVRNRFFAIYFICWVLLGNVVAAALMSGGPVYYAQLTGDEARFAGQLSYLAFSDGLHNSSVTLQKLLWAFNEQGQLNLGSGISAFPSLHVAMATLFALAGFELDRRLGWALTAFAALILAGSVHLAWHYAIDGYVSAAFVLVLWFGAARLRRVL